MKPSLKLLILISLLSAYSCRKDNPVFPGIVQVISSRIGSTLLVAGDTLIAAPVDRPLNLVFSTQIDTASFKDHIYLEKQGGTRVSFTSTTGITLSEFQMTPSSTLEYSTVYTLTITSSLKGSKGETFGGVKYFFKTIPGSITVDSVTINGNLLKSTPLLNVNPAAFQIAVTFSHSLDPDNYKSAFSFNGPALAISLSNDNKTVLASASSAGQGLKRYTLSISSSLTSAAGKTFNGYSGSFITGIDSTLKHPLITNDELLTLVQSQTFKYFWDFAHPDCGMARERNSSGDVVTTGGSGFGIMAIIVGIQRGFITRTEGLTRLNKILGFLETCDRFHGVWPHWLNGTNGDVVPFSAHDNGGDLVETSFMLQGLLCMRQYLDSNVVSEKAYMQRINDLFDAVEFDFYTNNENTLYWAWSPNYGYNLRIQGYNETLITYVIAASSKTHSISKEVYTSGYANNGGIKNGQTYYGYKLPLGQSYGGPLFFTHYSFLGLDPRTLKDQYADYWEQNVNQSLINYSYCQANPHKFPGYGGGLWGLTASDNPWGYNAHSPTNDLGVITPTAAISSIPYTPEKSMQAIRTFYYYLGDRLWGDYGFFDAYAITADWWADSFLAIDQGPEICMIENYRSGLLWTLFMTAPEVQAGLSKLGFTF